MRIKIGWRGAADAGLDEGEHGSAREWYVQNLDLHEEQERRGGCQGRCEIGAGFRTRAVARAFAAEYRGVR